MGRSNRLWALALLGWCIASVTAQAVADVERASGLIGRTVETRDGEPLGRVHDLAIDMGDGSVAYVVVSVGSFLIEDSLIAVAPDALRESADADRRLVLETDADTLRSAERFADTDWPADPDLIARTPASEPVQPAPDGDAEEAGEPPRRGTATISDGSKTATLSAGERSIRFVTPPPAPEAPESHEPAGETPSSAGTDAAPAGPFERLDRDGDGRLNRAEIAHEMRRGDRFADIDLDADGTIDPGEFAALMERRESAEAGDSDA